MDEINSVEETGIDETVKESETLDANGSGAPVKESFFTRMKYAEKPSPLYYIRETLSYILIFIVAVIIGTLINIYIFRLSRVNGNSMYPTLHNGEMLAASRLPVIFNDIDRGNIVIFDHTGKARNFGDDVKEALTENAIVVLLSGKKSESEETHRYYIKRVIGVCGDVIRVSNGKIYRTTLESLGEGYTDYIRLRKEYIADPGDAKTAADYNSLLTQISAIEPDASWEDISNESFVNPEEDPNYTRYEGKFWVVGEREIFVMGDNRNHSTDGRALGVRSLDCVIGKVLGNK